MVGFRLSETLSSMVRSPGAFAKPRELLQSVEEWTEISGSDQVSGKNPAEKVMPLTGEETARASRAFPPDAFSPLGEGFSRFLESMPDLKV